MEQELWEKRGLQTWIEDLNAMKEPARKLVMKTVQKLAQGERWQIRRDTASSASSASSELWRLAVEDTAVASGHLIWWVELDIQGQDAQQVMVLYRVCRREQLLEIKRQAEEYLRTFSDEYLEVCLSRKTDKEQKIAKPRTLPVSASFNAYRDVTSHLEMAEGRPVSLEKRYHIQQKHMEMLIKHGMENIQLPYVLDNDEEHVLKQVCNHPVFLLGRSGSGKTTVMCHALFYLHAKPEEWFRDCQVGPVLLITRSERLSSAIQTLFLQMCDSEGSGEGESCQPCGATVDGARANLDVPDEEQTFHKMPKSFKKEDMGHAKTLICHWKEFLLTADASLPPPKFFRHATESKFEKASRRMQQESGRTLQAAERFTQLAAEDGKHELKNELTYEFFVANFASNLIKGKVLEKSDSLYVVYKEILTVIIGSLKAVRSGPGALSREEYVLGVDSEGNRLPESNDSAVKDQACRSRIYSAFEEYKKMKDRSSRYDRIDPVRHITQRAKELGRKKRYQMCEKLAAVFIDEVQDLLPAEILLLRLFCPTNKGWIFAGDTAQTISKGVDFRFESIRRLFYDEFLSGKDWTRDIVQVKRKKCSECGKTFREGTELKCTSNWEAHMVYLCEDAKCWKAWEKRCQDAAKGLSSGAQKKKEWADARQKYSCPKKGCGVYMKEEKLKFEASAASDEDEEKEEFLPNSDYSKVPPIQHLTHNHRSTKGILELAGTVIELLMSLFPGRVDALPREVSRVDAPLRPVFVNGLKLKDLNDLIFRDSDSTADGRVLEFGAQQAALVWSSQAHAVFQAMFEMSMVLTIDECKGLEFEDVIIINPFSDMAQHGPPGLKSLWGYVLPEQRSTFNDSTHALLCSWLKCLYVATTRARRRLWIIEEDERFGGPMMTLWKENVQAVTSLEEAERVREGFARSSSPEEFVEEGRRMLEQRKFLEASICFRRAAQAEHPTAEYWRQLTQAQHVEQEIELFEDWDPKKTRKQVECAKAYLGLSEALKRLGEQLGDTTSLSAKLQAAEKFVEARCFEKAANLYLEMECYAKAAKCFEAEEKWLEAGLAWCEESQWLRAMWDFLNGQHFEDFASCAASAYDAEDGDEAMLPTLRKWVKDALRQMVNRGVSNSDFTKPLLKLLCRSLEQNEVDAFVSKLNDFELEFRYLEEQKRFSDCAALCLQTQRWDRAHEMDLRFQVTSRSLLLGVLQGLRLPKGTTVLQTNSCYEQLRKGKFSTLGDLDQDIWKHVTRLEEGFGSVEDWTRFWTNLNSQDNGYFIRLQCLALQPLAMRNRGSESRKRLDIPIKLMKRCMKEVDNKIAELSNKLQTSIERSSDLSPDVEKQIFQLILAEQPDCIRPSYLIMGEPGRFSCEEALEHARKELVILRTALHCQMLSACQRSLQLHQPCKFLLWHGSCKETGCLSLHSWSSPESQRFAELFQLSFHAWETARKVMSTHLFFSVLQSSSEEGQKASYWIDKMEIALLHACLPHPWHIWSLIAPGREDSEVVNTLRDELLRRAIEQLSLKVVDDAKRYRTENLQLALVRAPGVLVWCRLVDYHCVPFLRSVLDANNLRWRRNLRLPSSLLTLLETQRESVPRLRLATESMSYKHLVNRFSFGIEVVQDLRRLWRNSKENFQCAPRTLIHLLEESACWALVLLTQFSNTTLPRSWVQNHLVGSEHLAKFAAENALPSSCPNWRSWVIKTLAELIEVAAVFVHDPELPKWARNHNELPAEVVLRLYIIIFSCGTINWLRHIRNEKIIPAVRKNLPNRLAVMNRDKEWNQHSLPRLFQWLVIGPPRGKSVALHEEGGAERQFDQMTPWFHSVMCGLKDELVILHRLDTTDSPPSWTFGQRPLEFHRFDHINAEDQRHLKPYEKMWPPEYVVIRYPPVRKIHVFGPSWDACDFSGIHNSTASVAGGSGSRTDGFTLDKNASTKDAEEVKADETEAEKMAVKKEELPPWVEARLLDWLASIRARLRKRAVTKFDQLCSTSLSFLAKRLASPMQKAMYFRWVLPILNQIHEDSSLKQLRSVSLAQKEGMGRQKLEEGEGPMHDLMEVVEVVEKIEVQNDAFRKKYEQRVVEEGRLNDLDQEATSFRRRRKQLRGDLGQLLRRLHHDIKVDWMHFLLPVMIQNKLREDAKAAKKRLEARAAR